MPKLKLDPITEQDLVEFLRDESDFGFELSTLSLLTSLGFACEHAGTYQDPVTAKPRQFDIRATKQVANRIVRLAVEAKNLKPNYPLLVSCMPRTDAESYYEVVFSVEPERLARAHLAVTMPRGRVLRLDEGNSCYRPGDFVGKATDQVGRTLQASLVYGDTEVYEKWAQAVSSAQDLAERAYDDCDKSEHDAYVSAIFPVLVVPPGTLWMTHFDQSGVMTAVPQPTDRCPLFIDKKLSVPYYGRMAMVYHVSHLELVTTIGLRAFANELLCGVDAAAEKDMLFPQQLIRAKLADALKAEA